MTHDGGIDRLRRLWAAPTFWLTIAAAAPFAPGAWQFLRRGVADVLATGDGAAIEIGTLHAAHGTQLVGPYSRFQWSHPGPAFFYLSCPLYEAFHRRGPAINLTAFLLNIGCAVAIVLSARRIGGVAFALAAALLLAAYESFGVQFQLAGAWNPSVPILPLGLVSLLCARIALGDPWAVPGFAFVASAVVETHIGYLPVVAVLVAFAVAIPALKRLRRWRRGASAGSIAAGRPSAAGPAALTVVVLLILWLPPLLDCVENPPGNLVYLYRFFTAPSPPEHTWASVLEAVSRQLVHLPVAVAQSMGFSAEPSPAAVEWMAGGWCLSLLLAAVAGGVRGDVVSVVLASIAVGEALAAVLAVRAVRGEVHVYLVTWISLVGLVGLVALARWSVVAMERRRRAAVRGGLVAAAAAGLLCCVQAQAGVVDVYGPGDPEVERFAREIHGYLTTARTPPPVLEIVDHQVWPKAVAVVLYLFKTNVPFFVSRDWLFMMGREFAPPREERPLLLIGDRAFFDKSRARPDLHLVAVTADVCAFLSDPTYLTDHRVAGVGTLLDAHGVRGDPARAVDAIVPTEGERWDSPLSVVLESTGSALEVRVPSDAVSGVVLSADSGDIYSVRCRREDGAVVDVGTVSTVSRSGVGVATAAVYSETLRACRSVLVSPASGDGYYSVGEIGFVKP